MVTFTTIILVSATITQLFFWWVVFRPFINFSNAKSTTNDAVTIMVCAKNEEENLQKNIPSWLSQNHKPCDTLIVDDFSGIKTVHLIENMRRKDRYLYYYKVKLNKAGKKQAIIEGLSNCRQNYVLLTDADCQPASNAWAGHMLNAAKQQKADIILGYSPYYKRGNQLLQNWIQYETWYTGISYLSFAIMGWPYMGVGRNILYRKKILTEEVLNKFNLASGDDDLTVNQLATKENTGVCVDPEAFVYSEPETTWRSYFQQKRRHFSTPKYYKIKHKVALSMLSGSHILFFLCCIFLFINKILFVPLLLIVIRFVIISPIVIKLLKKLKSPISYLEFIILDLLHPIYYIVFSFAILFPKKNNW